MLNMNVSIFTKLASLRDLKIKYVYFCLVKYIDLNYISLNYFFSINSAS